MTYWILSQQKHNQQHSLSILLSTGYRLSSQQKHSQQHSLSILLSTGYRVNKTQSTTLSIYTPIYGVSSQQKHNQQHSLSILLSTGYRVNKSTINNTLYLYSYLLDIESTKAQSTTLSIYTPIYWISSQQKHNQQHSLSILLSTGYRVNKSTINNTLYLYSYLLGIESTKAQSTAKIKPF